MEDDGMFLNISTMKPKTKKQSISKENKTQIKKQKYVKKMKQMNVRKGKNNSLSPSLIKGQSIVKTNVIFEKNDGSNQKQKEKKNEKKRDQPKINKNNDIKDYIKKRSKPQKPSTYEFENRQKVKVEELLEEKVSSLNNIDKTQVKNFALNQRLEESLEKSGVAKLTDIQVKSFKPLSNKADSVIKASTGSGKTLAYLIPIVNRIVQEELLMKREDGTVAMIICPTRQLCVQGQKQVLRCLKRLPFIIPGCLYGGEETNHQKSRLRKGTSILFCTPGRVLYHLQNTQSFKLNSLKVLIFQEADRTLDMGFEQTINKVLEILQQKTSLPHLHKILVSAHFNTKVSSLLQKLEMSNPKFIGFEENMNLQKLKDNKDLEINTSSQLKQQYVLVSEDQKIPFMLAYLGLLNQSKALLFVSTIDEVQFFDYLLSNLKYRDSNGLPTEVSVQKRRVFKIHGDLDQKLRSKTYLEFREAKEAILISTEVAARGLDFPNLSHIILFDVPPTITDYGNRVGRSARFNQTGVSLLMLHYQQSDYAQKIRYYAPNLQVIDKQVIFKNYQKVLKSMNIGDDSLHYIEGVVRGAVKDDDEKYQVARKAYVSMLRAYSRMNDKHIFHVKNLNLKLLARTFGLNNAQADKQYNPKAKQSHLQTLRKKRTVQNVKKLQVSEYL